MSKTAIVFGGSGLVGSYLIDELSKNSSYTKIISVGRRELGISADKLVEVVVDFDKIDMSLKDLQGDEVYICLGTTIKKAGSVQRMEEIDRDMPIEIAQQMCNAGIKKIGVISSIGANSKSKNYYLRIKGEMEDGIRNLSFQKTAVVRPSIILGKRNSQRFGETVGKILMQGVGFLMIGKLRKYRVIHAKTIARSMIVILSEEIEGVVFESDSLQKLDK